MLLGIFTQITLQVCQVCNLRCKYCAYAGNYEHQRIHSNKNMSLDVMKKSVDFVMNRSHDVEEITIGFYGGEPLLEIENIKLCIAYIREAYSSRAVRYTVTTNGTLFNDDILNFLRLNKFSVNISFDGPQELHDLNRVFSDGSGSYEKIMSNVRYIKEKYPDVFENVSFLTVVAPGVDLACINEFFNASDVLSNNMVNQNLVNAFSSKKDIVYDDLYVITRNYQYMKVLLSALGWYKNKTSILFKRSITDVEVFYKSLSQIKMGEKSHPSGPCLPGAMRPIVTVDGDIYPCERVNENASVMKIGNVDTGFDLDRVKAILNVGKITEEECKVCWNFFHCNLCAAACDGGESLSRDMRLKNCDLSKRNAIETFRTICLLEENGYKFV